MRACVRAFVRVCVCACVYNNIMYVYVLVCAFLCVHTHACVLVCTCMWVHMHLVYSNFPLSLALKHSLSRMFVASTMKSVFFLCSIFVA